MPRYDYRCTNEACTEHHIEFERTVAMAVRHDQMCALCSQPLEKLDRPTPKYKPFHPYFDEGLGVEVTGRDHRRRVMRDLGMDFRDHPSPGARSARLDKVNEQIKERQR